MRCLSSRVAALLGILLVSCAQADHPDDTHNPLAIRAALQTEADGWHRLRIRIENRAPTDYCLFQLARLGRTDSWWMAYYSVVDTRTGRTLTASHVPAGRGNSKTYGVVNVLLRLKPSTTLILPNDIVRASDLADPAGLVWSANIAGTPCSEATFDHDLQAFVWRHSSDAIVVQYEVKEVPFGREVELLMKRGGE